MGQPIGWRNSSTNHGRRPHSSDVRINEVIEPAEREVSFGHMFGQNDFLKNFKTFPERDRRAGQVDTKHLSPNTGGIISYALFSLGYCEPTKDHFSRSEIFWEDRESFRSPDELSTGASISDFRAACGQQFGFRRFPNQTRQFRQVGRGVGL